MVRKEEREVEWGGDSKEAIRSLPGNVRWSFGRALYKAQLGKRPNRASPMKGRLRGVVEIADDERGDTYRLYYTLKCSDFVFVLHCHKKKSKKGSSIPKHEEDLILQRFKDAMEMCEELHRETS